MPVSVKYVRENPEKEYVLDMPGHEFHGEEGTVCINGSTGVIFGIELGINNYTHFIPCGEDNITVKGNLQHYGPNGEGAADDGELYYVGSSIEDAIKNNMVYVELSDARDTAAYWKDKIFKVQIAIFFDTAEEVK